MYRHVFQLSFAPTVVCAVCLIAGCADGDLAKTQRGTAPSAGSVDSSSPDSSTERRVQKVVEDLLAKNVAPEASLVELGADELDIVEIVLALEEEFDVAIPDEQVTVKSAPDTFAPDPSLSIKSLTAIVRQQQAIRSE